MKYYKFPDYLTSNTDDFYTYRTPVYDLDFCSMGSNQYVRCYQNSTNMVLRIGQFIESNDDQEMEMREYTGAQAVVGQAGANNLHRKRDRFRKNYI